MTPSRSPRRWTSVRVLAATAVVAALAVPAASAQSLDQARAERAAVQERLDAAAEELATLETRVADLEAEREELATEVRRLSSEATTASQRITERVRTIFIHGTTDPLLELIGGADPQRAVDAAARVGQLVRGDRGEAEVAIAARTRAGAAADELAAREVELADARDAQAATTERLEDELAAAAALEKRLEDEERRRREAEERAAAAAAAAARRQAAASTGSSPSSSSSSTSSAGPAAPSSGGIACPVGRPHSFTDTWGAGRSGGRSHKGVDILSPRGTPVYAYVSGVWDIRNPGNLAGNWAILRGDNGTTYYYMHLQSHTVGDGARVSAGQQTGTIGDTGNARGTPHLHWEVHPGGGGAVNPTPYARRGCG